MNNIDHLIPLPTKSEGYSHVVLTGGSGVGKSTIARHLLGTEQDEAFPSTSKSKTTIFDTEIIVSPGLYQAVSAFISREDCIDHLIEMFTICGQRYAFGEADEDLLQRLYEHPEQRFRLRNIIGLSYQEGEKHLWYLTLLDKVKAKTDEIIGLIDNVDRESDGAYELISETLSDFREFYNEISQSVATYIADLLKKFPYGKVEADDSGWPILWHFESTDRKTFLHAIKQIGGNLVYKYDHIFSPIVAKMRIKGPFYNSALDPSTAPRLVIIDQQGIGHTQEYTLSSDTIERLLSVDRVLLVEDSTKAGQISAKVAIDALMQCGIADKLVIAFTRMEQMDDENLPDEKSQKDHIIRSIKQVIWSRQSDRNNVRALKLEQSLNSRCMFFASLDKSSKDLSIDLVSKRNLEIAKLINELTVVEQGISPKAYPVYDYNRFYSEVYRANFESLQYFERRFIHHKEHLERLRALSRRIKRDKFEYDTIRPVSVYLNSLMKCLEQLLANPVKWSKPGLSADDKQVIIDKITHELASKLHLKIMDLLIASRKDEWLELLEFRGSGSRVRTAERVISIMKSSMPTQIENDRSAETMRQLMNLMESVVANIRLG